mmetsp:Transcript_21075/g.39609  ORF Transcript_21075/g.39609 Transcript_21075/m.39609 type:complete len:92 (+) Transcript_21075:524-799(+)
MVNGNQGLEPVEGFSACTKMQADCPSCRQSEGPAAVLPDSPGHRRDAIQLHLRSVMISQRFKIFCYFDEYDEYVQMHAAHAYKRRTDPRGV